MITDIELTKGNTYIICDKDVPIGTYTYIGKKSGVNDQEKMARFLMFKKEGHTSSYEIIEGYEITDKGLVEPTITIRSSPKQLDS